MNEIRISSADLASLRSRLLVDSVERCAILLAATASSADVGGASLIVREMHFPGDDDYLRQTSVFAQLAPAFVARLTKRAQTEKLQLIFVHSHLSPSPPEFSVTDDAGEQELASFMERRELTGMHGALVLSPGGLRARVMGSMKEVRVVSIGTRRLVEFDPAQHTGLPDDQYDRQIRAFGAAGQAAIQRLRVAIVGLGGTGSVLVQQLVHLGVRDFLVIDPDVIERTNLNRVVGAKAAVGAHGVVVASPGLDDHAGFVAKLIDA
jgi:hypothetical protein